MLCNLHFSCCTQGKLNFFTHMTDDNNIHSQWNRTQSTFDIVNNFYQCKKLITLHRIERLTYYSTKFFHYLICRQIGRFLLCTYLCKKSFTLAINRGSLLIYQWVHLNAKLSKRFLMYCSFPFVWFQYWSLWLH